MKEWSASANGSLFSLPAGDVQLAVGGNYRKEYLRRRRRSADLNTLRVDASGTPIIPAPVRARFVGSPAQGGFNIKEAYAELLVPVLKDAPFVHSLNIDIGDRYSKYSNFGSTNNWKVARRIPADRRPAAAWHGVESIPRADADQPVRGSRRRRADGDRSVRGRHRRVEQQGVPGTSTFRTRSTAQLTGYRDGFEVREREQV